MYLSPYPLESPPKVQMLPMLGKLPPEVIDRLIKEEQARLKSIDESKTMIRSIFFSEQVNLGWQAVINVIQNILKKRSK